jgi:hypothetical protein
MDEVLLLLPDPEGTTVHSAGALRDVRELLKGGLSMADAVIPRTVPRRVEQLTLFSE